MKLSKISAQTSQREMNDRETAGHGLDAASVMRISSNLQQVALSILQRVHSLCDNLESGATARAMRPSLSVRSIIQCAHRRVAASRIEAGVLAVYPLLLNSATAAIVAALNTI